MNKSALPTPCTLVDEGKLRKNIEEAQAVCNRNGKALMPMTKTHKSSYIAKLQMEAGAAGLLVGSILEAERFALLAPKHITFAYPFLGERNLMRMRKIGEKTSIAVSVDTLETASIYHAFCKKNGLKWDYFLLVDVGLHRFGVDPEQAGKYVREIASAYPNLSFIGIASHPGQVYAATSLERVAACFRQEETSLRRARDSVRAEGFPCGMVASGSTPTFSREAESGVITAVRPGNYVFYDVVQTALGTDADRCSLTVLATIISKRGDRKWVMDAGSKCLGLDKGAHGNSGVVGYGRVVGYESLTVTSLSEEVGILESETPLTLSIGDRVEIIPNHSCSAANMTSRVVLCRGDEAGGYFDVDARETTVVMDEYLSVLQPF